MIFFIYGPDTFRSREKLSQIIEQFQKKRDSSGLNVVRLREGQISLDRLRQEALTQGFLSPKKMVVIEQLLTYDNQSLFEETATFIKSFAKSEQDNILVFWEGGFTPKKKTDADKAAGSLFNLLKKQEYVYSFPELDNQQLNAWVSRTVSQRGGRIQCQAARELAATVGTNLWQLSNDIDRLVAYRQKEEITTQDVERQVRGTFEANIFALTDAIAAQDKARALKLLNHELAAGSKEVYLLTMITRQFRILVQLNATLAQGNLSAEKVAKALNLHPFVVKKSLPAAKKYTLQALQKTYTHLVTIDQKLKLSYPNPKLLLELLVVD